MIRKSRKDDYINPANGDGLLKVYINMCIVFVLILFYSNLLLGETINSIVT